MFFVSLFFLFCFVVHVVVFSSPDPKGQVSYCYHLASVEGP